MPYKPRTESTELLILRSLHTRMNLLEKDKQHYFNLKKGYEGEVMFDSLTEKLQCECFIVNDLLLKTNNTMCEPHRPNQRLWTEHLLILNTVQNERLSHLRCL